MILNIGTCQHKNTQELFAKVGDHNEHRNVLLIDTTSYIHEITDIFYETMFIQQPGLSYASANTEIDEMFINFKHYKHKNTGIDVIEINRNDKGYVEYIECETLRVYKDREIFFDAVYDIQGYYI